MGMSMRISRSLLARLLAIAAADSAREVCGLLLGQAGAIEAYVEATNVAADPQISFEIDPRVQIDAAKAARDGGPQVIGCYHSHPSGVARPSAWDLEMAEPGAVWLIFAGGAVTAWQRGDTQFQELSLEVW
jgi:desampylase